MSGRVVVEGSASQSAGATARGGLLVIHGDASARCGISLKGADIVVRGSIGHMSAFMAQKGCLVVCGDAGEALGDSLYEARLYVRGSVDGLGADCIEKEMRAEHLAQLRELLERAGIDDVAPGEFRRYGSARRLYNFHVDNLGSVLTMAYGNGWHPGLRESATFDRNVIAEIQRAAREGIYDIRGFGAKRARAPLRRPAVPRRVRLALSARGLPRALRHRRRDRHPVRARADPTGHPDHDRRA